MTVEEATRFGDFFDQPVLGELCQVAESAGWKVAFAYDPSDLRQPSGNLVAGASIPRRRVVLLHPGLWDSVIWAIFVLVQQLALCLLSASHEASGLAMDQVELEANTVRKLVCVRLGIRVFDCGTVLNPPHSVAITDAATRILAALLPYLGRRSA